MTQEGTSGWRGHSSCWADFGELRVLTIWWIHEHQLMTMPPTGVFLSLVPCSTQDNPAPRHSTRPVTQPTVPRLESPDSRGTQRAGRCSLVLVAEHLGLMENHV